MIVKVEWTEHNRTYSIGIVQFLKALGYDVDEKTIKEVIYRYLSTNE
jgi:hypothetical protein